MKTLRGNLPKGAFPLGYVKIGRLHYKWSDGKIMEGYFPKSGDSDKIDVVSGTHASAGFLAHARAKFVYAYEQGGDLNAKRMLEYIGWLYVQEDSCRQSV